MCGIVGCWNLASRQISCEQDIQMATKSLTHRGPDDSGVWTNNAGVWLGHTRLAILDLTDSGHQPISSMDGRYVLVFNGEIYNYRAIREILIKKGYTFKGNSDTEVVLVAYQEWGSDCVKKFIGMFAFAIWDEKEKRLSLCRDRVGVKPLYYSWISKTLIFASELKAYCAFNRHISLVVDNQSLGEYLQYGYISAPRTIYQKVYKLLPGHWLHLGKVGEPKLEQYWSVQNSTKKKDVVCGEKEMVDQLEELLVDAFKLRMIADVPVGVFLSGGIDSSLVASILQSHHSQQIHTYTIGFKEKQYDESGWAKKVASHLGTKHTEYILSLDTVKEVVDKVASIFDEPFGDSSSIPTYIVSMLAREEVKVALSADGGDELFGGYSNYTVIPSLVGKLRKIPSFLRRGLGRGIRNLPESWISYPFYLGKQLRIEKSYFSEKAIDRFFKLGNVMPEVKDCEVFDAAHSLWLSPQVDKLIGGYVNPRPMANVYNMGFQEQMMLWDFNNYLPDDVLVKVDRSTMAVGLEGREPFLDHRLVEFAFRLPLKYRIGELGGKHLLKQVLQKYLPIDMIERPKQGFSIPLEKWLRHDLVYLLDNYLNEEVIRSMGYFDYKTVSAVVDSFIKGIPVSASKIWLLLIFSMWHEKSASTASNYL